MKKYLLTVILILTTGYLYSQEPASFSKVITVPNITADTLHLLSKQWYLLNFVNPQKVIQDDNKEMKIVTLRASVVYSYGRISYLAFEGYVSYLIQIQSKDGRIKVTITNFYHDNLPGNDPNSQLGLILNEEEQFKKGLAKGYKNNVAKDIKAKMEVIANTIFTDIERYMNHAKLKSEDNW